MKQNKVNSCTIIVSKGTNSAKLRYSRSHKFNSSGNTSVPINACDSSFDPQLESILHILLSSEADCPLTQKSLVLIVLSNQGHFLTRDTTFN